MLSSFVVCDLETTGLIPRQHEIIEIGMVRVEGGKVTTTFHTLVRPKKKLPVGIRRLTGLDDSLLETSPKLHEVLPDALAFIRGYPLVGHNIGFDKGFLEVAGGPLDNPVYDTLELARILLPASSGYRLGDLCQFLGIVNPAGHRALSDALATVELYHRLLQIASGLDTEILLYLNSFLQKASSPWVTPLAALLQRSTSSKISAPLFPLPQAQNILSNEDEEEIHVEREGLAALLTPGGLLASRLENYEYRPQQEQMINAVSQALYEKRYLLMEAGTGTGKSMSYLIPALHWAIKNNQRVVVSTHTINLQEQLWKKDNPLITKALSWPCKAVLVKGRQNYLCLRRWFSILATGDCTPVEAAFYARLLLWTTRTTTGDKAELNLNMAEQEIWTQICADSETCLGVRCQWYSRCYVTRIRKAAEEANLIITNHSLLISDVRVDNKLLPSYESVIIDEAHHLEDVATEQLAQQVSWAILKRWSGGINKMLTRMAETTPPEDADYWLQILKEAQDARKLTWQRLDTFFKALNNVVITQGGSGTREAGRWTLRLKKAILNKAQHLATEFNNLKLAWENLLDLLKKLEQIIERWSDENEVWAEHNLELSQQLDAGSAYKEDLEFIFCCKGENYVHWVEVTGENEAGNCILRAAPIHVGEVLHRQLFKQKDSIICTSATLTVEGSFQHFMERTGIDLVPLDRLQRLQVASPFSYDHQSLLCVIRDIPLQGEVPDESYYSALLSGLTGLIQVIQGKTLVLFTSHRVLQETYHRLKDFCEEMDICLLAHNIDGSRTRLIEEFRTTERAVLLGAASFWEGVDIPGEALTCVVIVKLPFWAPSIPIIEARLEDLARQKKDGFYEFSLPQAVIRFKQGFGRLIRSMQDRGVVVVLDGRLVNKPYGKYFLNSLPIKTHVRGSTSTVINRIKRWLKTS